MKAKAKIEPHLRASHVATLLDMSPAWVKIQHDRGELSGRLAGSDLLLSTRSVLAYLANHAVVQDTGFAPAQLEAHRKVLAVAVSIGMSPAWVKARVKDGTFIGYRMERDIIVNVGSVNDYLAERKEAA